MNIEFLVFLIIGIFLLGVGVWLAVIHYTIIARGKLYEATIVGFEIGATIRGHVFHYVVEIRYGKSIRKIKCLDSHVRLFTSKPSPRYIGQKRQVYYLPGKPAVIRLNFSTIIVMSIIFVLGIFSIVNAILIKMAL